MNSLPIIDAPAHAKFAPSAASRWLNCNASVDYVEDRVDDYANAAAQWGTEVHEIVAINKLVRGTFPKHWTPEQCDDAALCIDEYVKHVPYNAQREIKIFSKRWPTLLFGTIDALWIEPSNCVNIADLKTGLRGVNSSDNAQLLCYAFLASDHYPAADTFRVTIIQPRRQCVSTDVYTRTQVAAFGEKIATAIESRASFVAGPHCHFCPYRANCSTLHNSLLKLLTDAQDLGLWEANLAGKTELSY